MFTTIAKVSVRTLPVLAMTVLLVQNHAQVTVVPRALTGFQIPTKDPRATALLTFSITAMSGGRGLPGNLYQ